MRIEIIKCLKNYAIKAIFQIHERLNLPDAESQCSPIQFLMIGHNQLAKWVVIPENNMTAGLALDIKSYTG